MPLFANLLAKLPESIETRMSSQGYALWISWQTDIDPILTQTLQNYGGMFIVSDREQSLWYFFNTDVFLALARISVWARFNPLAATIQLLPARLRLGLSLETTIDVDMSFEKQEVLVNDKLEVWIHPKTYEKTNIFPGLTFTPVQQKQGMAHARWQTMEADPRLPYSSTLGWYALLRPLGNQLDKSFQAAWPHMQQGIVDSLKQQKLKFLVQDQFIMVSVDNLLLLRSWLRELLLAAKNIKETEHEHYWPYVSVIVDRKGMNFNADLHKKVGLQWDRLSADLPYISYRNAYLLGKGFIIQDIRFSDSLADMDSWCSILLDEGGDKAQSIPVLMPNQFTGGDGKCCFFCGINTHTTEDCPTNAAIHLLQPTSVVQAGMSLEKINESFRALEKRVSKKGLEAYPEVLEQADTPSLLLQEIFDINVMSQVRIMQHMWLTKGRDLGKVMDPTMPERDEGPVWELYDRFIKATSEELLEIERDIQAAITRNPRDTHLRTLLGFLHVRRAKFNSALTAFKEGATLTTSSALQAWNEYLQARIAEVEGQYVNAVAQYEQVQRVIPHWRELEYRRIVCKVKMGFAEQVLNQISKLIHDDPTYFNRCLIDPELGRGQILILSHLQPLWQAAEKAAKDEQENIRLLSERIRVWFPIYHPSYHILHSQLTEIQNLADTQSYVSFLQVVKRRPVCEKEVGEYIQRQVEELRERYQNYLNNLQMIRDEASWFPFPKILREFSREFNEAANALNWAFASNFEEAEVFQKALEDTDEVEKLLRSLRKKLNFLRAVRDGTLYSLTFLKTFMWIEIVGILICFLGIPALIYFGDDIGLGFIKRTLALQQWEIQKVLFAIITVISLGLAALRSTIIFDKRRDKLLEDAKLQREKLQNARLNRIRKRRKAEADKLAAERRRAEMAAQRKRMRD